ncbi:fimbrial protein [Erwinia psidii]|uniref:Type 1 fimbrial protein n=1 Tax=Erwinia psidii TaxID=69224 RepID=A0A3N6S2C9_9GAMM|nr:fimbrial protein [Erwinia psidii]MCX8958675.1 type 1 fimbrial protein [Erwinia psidii]MCX8961196.1 type 1 fimbrial protein [Erwinia psidii]MCX8966832.1 type 1 fimbrial protein [Erwinia psidii]RQM38987.1 type 1 fimbrial protein [Erwinia psidii]
MRNFKVVVCALTLGMTISAQAANEVTQGTVEFDGKLITETCSIDTDSQTIKVTLPTLSTQTLTAAGAVAGSKSIDINVSGCPTGTSAGITQVAAHFEAIGGSGVNSSTGNLTNAYTGSETKAGNVEVRLFDADGVTQLTLGETGTAFDIDNSTGKASMRYYGAYYATDTTTAGKVYAKAQYTLAYP